MIEIFGYSINMVVFFSFIWINWVVNKIVIVVLIV